VRVRTYGLPGVLRGLLAPRLATTATKSTTSKPCRPRVGVSCSLDHRSWLTGRPRGRRGRRRRRHGLPGRRRRRRRSRRRPGRRRHRHGPARRGDRWAGARRPPLPISLSRALGILASLTAEQRRRAAAAGGRAARDKLGHREDDDADREAQQPGDDGQPPAPIPAARRAPDRSGLAHRRARLGPGDTRGRLGPGDAGGRLGLRRARRGRDPRTSAWPALSEAPRAGTARVTASVGRCSPSLMSATSTGIAAADGSVPGAHNLEQV